MSRGCHGSTSRSRLRLRGTQHKVKHFPEQARTQLRSESAAVFKFDVSSDPHLQIETKSRTKKLNNSDLCDPVGLESSRAVTIERRLLRDGVNVCLGCGSVCHKRQRPTRQDGWLMLSYIMTMRVRKKLFLARPMSCVSAQHHLAPCFDLFNSIPTDDQTSQRSKIVGFSGSFVRTLEHNNSTSHTNPHRFCCHVRGLEPSVQE